MKSGSPNDPRADHLLYQSAQNSPRLGFVTGITQTRQTAGHGPEHHKNRVWTESKA